jgi:hypothetical protein
VPRDRLTGMDDATASGPQSGEASTATERVGNRRSSWTDLENTGYCASFATKYYLTSRRHHPSGGEFARLD